MDQNMAHRYGFPRLAAEVSSKTIFSMTGWNKLLAGTPSSLLGTQNVRLILRRVH
jgi:hypothetical protein